MRNKIYTKEILIPMLHDLAKRLDCTPNRRQWGNDKLTPSDGPVRAIFGKWHQFLTAAGIPNNGRSAKFKTGTIITNSGYKMVWVGKKHHLANINGYALAHRLIVEKMIGRRLKRGEQVHHKDGDRLNNQESNLLVCASQLHHYVHHRVREGLRMPDEQNIKIECECGCGQIFLKYDRFNRPRRFIFGHQSRGSHMEYNQ